jgi:hypothetical protein
VTPRLTAVERQAIVDGTDPVSLSRPWRRRPGHWSGAEHVVADLPPEPEIIERWAWEDRLADEDEDRTLTGELPPGYDRRCFGVDEL